MECDHVLGAYGTHPVRASQWESACAGFGRAVQFFNTTRLAVPVPGQLRAHAFCSDCGRPLDEAGTEKAVIAALNTPVGPEHTRESYMAWLLAPVSTPDKTPSAD